MKSVVPFIGGDVLEKNDALKSRIRYIIEEDFGHELRFVDEGSVFALHQADPLKVLVPFAVAIEGAINPLLTQDIWEPIKKLFPSSSYIEAPLEHLPRILKSRAEELSLGHVNGAPIFIRREVKEIYKNLSEHEYDLRMIARDIGISRSALQREFTRIGEHGAGQLLLRIRMAEARRMVLDTECSINDIAAAVGYDDLPVFDRAFFRAWRSSPTQLRRNAKSLGRNAKFLTQYAK